MPKPNIFYRQMYKYGSQFSADYNKYCYNRLRNITFDNFGPQNTSVPQKDSLQMKDGEIFLLTAITASYTPYIEDQQAVDLSPRVRFLANRSNRKLMGGPDDPEAILPEKFTAMNLILFPGMDINPLRDVRRFSYMFLPKENLDMEIIHTWPKSNWTEETPQELKIELTFLGLVFRPSSLVLLNNQLA